MKRNIIIVVVILAAALAVLKYLASRGQDEAASVPSQQEQAPEGVSLPEGAMDYGDIPSESVYAHSQASGSYDTLTLPDAALSLKGACKGGSPKDMVEDHGKVWGYFTGERISFNQDQSKAMYEFFGDYYACMAAARKDLSYCNNLPGDIESEGMKIDLVDSPMGYCREKAGSFLFMAYVAGKIKERSVCSGYVSDWDSRNISRVSIPDFCDAAAKGPEAVTGYTRENLPDILPMAERLFPFGKRACKSDPVCLNNNAIWEGLRTGKASGCPVSHRAHCGALLKESQVPCVAVLTAMSKKYCDFRDRMRKDGLDFIGMTDSEVKEELRKRAEEKAEKEKRRKEEDARTKEINSRIKKMLGTEGE